jgi:hypothetical protein
MMVSAFVFAPTEDKDAWDVKEAEREAAEGPREATNT